MKQTRLAMLPPLNEQPAAIDRVPDELGDPSHRLRLYFGGGRRQCPGADVGVDRRGEQVAQHANRRWRRSDVAKEARMPVEQGMIEQQLCRALEKQRGVHPRFRERTGEVERAAHGRR